MFITIYIYQQSAYLVCMGILNKLYIYLKRPYIYIIFMVLQQHFVFNFNQECFSYLFTSYLRKYSAFLWVHITFWTNVLEGIKDGNTSIFFCLVFLNFKYYINWIFEIDLSIFPFPIL